MVGRVRGMAVPGVEHARAAPAPRPAAARFGNQAMLRFLGAHAIGHAHEGEADRMATAAIARSQGAPSSVRTPAVGGAGRPLPNDVRARMEAGFGADFAAVRVHDTAADRALAGALAARAFTHGNHVYLGQGERANDLPLVAHELAHVVQATRDPAAHAGTIHRLAAEEVTSSVPMPNVVAENPLVAAMAEFESIQPSTTSSNVYQGTFRGKRFKIDHARYLELRAKVRDIALDSLRFASQRAETALDRYKEQLSVNQRHPGVAWFVRVIGRTHDPGPELAVFVAQTRAILADARLALDAGDFVAAAERIGDGERSAEQAALLVRFYVDQLIGTAELTTTVLQGVKFTAGVVLFLCAVAATGGAAGAGATALGLEGVAGTTTLFGATASTATWAVGVTTTAAIVEEVGVGTVKALDGDQVDWVEIAEHAAIQVIIARFAPVLGQRLSNGLGSAAVGNPWLRGQLARVGIARIVTILTNLLMHEGAQVFTTIIEDTVRALRGKPITWAVFGKHLYNRMLDPKGLLMSLLAGSLGGTQPEPSKSPAGENAAPVPPKPAQRPTTEAEAMRSLSQELGLPITRRKTAPVDTPPEQFMPTPAERAIAYMNEATPLNASGTPISVSPGASPRGQTFQSASMTSPKAFSRSVRADVGEGRAAQQAALAGEVILEMPQGTNVGGRTDFVSAARDPSGKLWVIANDAKTRSSANSTFEDPTPGLRPNWSEQVKAAVERCPEPTLRSELRTALAEGRVWVRQINVDLSPVGQGAVSGVSQPLPVGWGALLGPRDLEDKR